MAPDRQGPPGLRPDAVTAARDVRQPPAEQGRRTLRVATWNLNVKARPGAPDVLLSLDADVLLLTEAPPDLDLPEYDRTPVGPLMVRGQEWATVLSRRPIERVDRPHVGTVAAVIDGATYVCSVLPWGNAPEGDAYRGQGQSAQTVAALNDLEPYLHNQERLVWGGDWNHSLERPWNGSSTAGREGIDRLLNDLTLHAPTRDEERGAYPIKSIDHIAVPDPDATSQHVPVERRLSDHDAYVVTANLSW